MANLLIIDDEPDYRKYLKQLLTEEGYTVETAMDEVSALHVCRHFAPDVLIIDWMLRNRLHGLEIADLLREIRPDFKTIVITGYPSEEVKAKAARAGVEAFIEKPFALSVLLEAVRLAVRY